MYHVPCQFAERRTDPLSGTSIDEHWGPFSFTGHQKNRLTKLQLQKTNEKKNKDHQKKSLLPGFLKTEVFQMIFCLAPLKGRSPRRSPLCVFGGWTGVFHSAGCQWSDIDSLLAPPLISFFWYWPLCAMSQKKTESGCINFLGWWF